MNRYTHTNNINRGNERVDVGATIAKDSVLPAGFLLKNVSKARLTPLNVADSRVASLKVLAVTLLRQIESLEKQLTADSTPELHLQTEVHRFEAALIRNALAKTGGRQRCAARLLGVKVTTLNTKIKRHKINLNDDGDEAGPAVNGESRQAKIESDVVS